MSDNKKLEEILAKLGALEPAVIKIDSISSSLASLDAGVSSKFDSISNSLASIESEVSAIKVDVSLVREQIKRLGDELEAAVSRITALEAQQAGFSAAAIELKSELDGLKAEMNGLKQTALANDFVIHGLPPTTAPNQALSIVTKLGDFVGIQLTERDFSRLPFAVTNKTKTLTSIIGTFNNHQTKLNVFKACRTKRPIPTEYVIDLEPRSPFNGKEVRIRNSLTALNRTILAEALRTKGDLFKFAWDVNGRIFLKKNETARGIEVSSLGALRRIIADARISS